MQEESVRTEHLIWHYLANASRFLSGHCVGSTFPGQIRVGGRKGTVKLFMNCILSFPAEVH